ncbi:MAG: hypothetical protein ABFQ53_00465 [Patescibacteria group bacterium]
MSKKMIVILLVSVQVAVIVAVVLASVLFLKDKFTYIALWERWWIIALGSIAGFLLGLYFCDEVEGVIDITSRGTYPSNELSNLAEHEFTLDGVKCASMEGFLQSLKVYIGDPFTHLSGITAKMSGQECNNWKWDQLLYWQGVKYERDGVKYQELLDRAFHALATNSDFQKALLATENKKIIHSIGKDDIESTVLTEEEFCFRLTKFRERLKKLIHDDNTAQ